ncbi:uncharacterized protein LOC135096516 [Scylla paramamosain]|uniref:uncharacterized protein LOC135096516 n=1 Tax=Scylla paramamosain TaxID=85552 RepID=UPI003083284D
MKNTTGFRLLLLLLPLLPLLLAPGGLVGCAPPGKWLLTVQTTDAGYYHITSANATSDKNITASMCVRPHHHLKVVVGVEGSDKYHKEFLLEKDCFPGDQQWWMLLVEVELWNTDPNTGETKYSIFMRLAECSRVCHKTASTRGLESINVWASGAAQWTDCNNINEFHPPLYFWRHLYLCREVNFSSLSLITPATPTPYHHECTPPLTVPTGVAAGVIAGAAAVVVVVVVVVVVMVFKRRGEAAAEDVAMRPVESARE